MTIPIVEARTYSTFHPADIARQAWRGLTGSDRVREEVEVLVKRLRRDEARLREALGRDVEDLDLLEVGPGQLCARAGYFGLRNRVTAVDLDEIVPDLDLRGFLRMLRANGPGRVLKTMGRKALGLDARARAAWRETLGVGALPLPRLVRADVERPLPFAPATFDAIVSWSAFEHLPHPDAALRSLLALLRPGGVLYVGIHLYTSSTGHHDVRAFVGQADRLPPWAHLRPSTRALVRPSSFVNGWRLGQWRALFRALAPGATEFLERYGEEGLRRRLTRELREELRDYDDEELFAVEAFFRWRRP